AWPAFWAEFKDNIHFNERLTIQQKMHLLSCMLAGQARQVLANYDGTEDGYKAIIEQLHVKYNRPDVLRQQLIEQFCRKVKPVRTDGDLSGMQRLNAEMRSVHNALKHSRAPQAVLNGEFVAAIRSKCPPSVLQALRNEPAPT